MKTIKKIIYNLLLRFIRRFFKRLHFLIIDRTYSGKTNYGQSGEFQFYENIKDDCNIIFDVGCRNNSLFMNSVNKEVHYFDPVKRFIEFTKNMEGNPKSRFNNFGLSNKNEKKEFYPTKYTFVRLGEKNKTLNSKKLRKGSQILELRRGYDYIKQNNIKKIDFLKIDTEGFELEVLKGFGSYLNIVKYIQFEYSQYYIDANITLKEIVNYLYNYNFRNFSKIEIDKIKLIKDFKDDYETMNVVCFNSKIINNFKEIK